jgi:hypothetical protein
MESVKIGFIVTFVIFVIISIFTNRCIKYYFKRVNNWRVPVNKSEYWTCLIFGWTSIMWNISSIIISLIALIGIVTCYIKY